MKKVGVLKTREKVAYGLGDLGNNIAYGTMGFYLVFFLTDVAGLSAAWAGYVFLVIRGWNAVCDLLMGAITDRTKSKLGRRRPYLLIGALPLAISFAMLFQAFFDKPVQMIIYYTIAGILFSTMYSFVAIPYNSLMPELSQDYDERTSISGFKMAFSFVGSLLSAMGVTLIVDTIFKGEEQYAISFPVMGLVMGTAITVTILLAFFGTKERVKPIYPEGKTNFFHELSSLFRLKEYVLVLGIFIGNMVGFDVIMALYIYFMRYALKISDDISYIFMAVPLVVAVLVTPIWVKVSERLGKKKTYIISVVYFVIPLLSCLVLPANNMIATSIIVVLIGGGISASQVLTYALLPDIVEVDEMKNGVRREGIIYGSTMFLYKVASAVIVALVTSTMSMFGYVGTATVQSDSAITGIRILMGCIPALLFVISAILVKFLPLGKESFDKIKESISDAV